MDDYLTFESEHPNPKKQKIDLVKPSVPSFTSCRKRNMLNLNSDTNYYLKVEKNKNKKNKTNLRYQINGHFFDIFEIKL